MMAETQLHWVIEVPNRPVLSVRGESVTRGDRRQRELEARSSLPPLAPDGKNCDTGLTTLCHPLICNTARIFRRFDRTVSHKKAGRWSLTTDLTNQNSHSLNERGTELNVFWTCLGKLGA
jgi:hypothetical protein